MINRNKICLAASAGGHLTQLLKLKDAWEENEVFYVSSLDVVAERLSKLGKTYITGECNRQYPIKSLGVFIKCFKIILKEKPGVVISTGAAPALLVCIAAKIFGAKIIWLDSIANTHKLSMSGMMVRPFANLILSQWPEVAEKYKNVEFVGTVI